MSAAQRAAHVVVIGAGVGGLAAAVRLAAAGLRVTVLERAARPGGKMREVAVGGVPFDAGPSVLTMPFVFDELFAAAGERRQEHVRFLPVEPACRHFFKDGAVLDLYNDEPAGAAGAGEPWERSAAEVARVLGPRAEGEYRRYRRHAAGIYRAVERPFLRRALPRTPFGVLLSHDLGDAVGFLRLDARRSVWGALGRFFSDERLRVLFSRYATYCGSDPFRAPATLNVIPHVELGFGLFTVEGGMHRLAAALAGLAARRGAELRYGAEVARIELDAGERRCAAVHLAGGERLAADAVVANCDVAQIYERLLSDSKPGRRRAPRVGRLEASLSAHLRLVLARDTAGLPITHHNVFFSGDYAQEFAELRAGVPTDPTVYLCATPPPVPQGAGPADRMRWFFLVNAPPLGPGEEDRARGAEAGPKEAAALRARIAEKLRLAGVDLDRHAEAEGTVTPADFAAIFPHSRGSLYGSASNGMMSAFVRPRNQAPDLSNLFCVGGSTHPGAGVPMVALSAQISTELLLKRLRAA